jgi:hypothetical protein
MSLTNTVAVTYRIDNIYEDGTRIQTLVETEVPPPPLDEDSDEYADWENDHVFEHTGSDYPEGGDAGYFVLVLQSSDPKALEPGRLFEFC